MMEMIAAYLEQTPPLIRTMNQSFRDKDWLLLNATVHKILPSFSIMGISKEFEVIAKKIQVYAGTQLQPNGIDAMVLQLENVCSRACEELEEEYSNLKYTNS